MRQFNLEEYLKNPDKKIVTQDGCKVRIICTNRNCERYPVVALVQRGVNENAHCYTRDGLCLGCIRTLNDLFFVTEKKEGWINIYSGDYDGTSVLGENIFETKEEAEKAEENLGYLIATIKIEWEE